MSSVISRLFQAKLYNYNSKFHNFSSLTKLLSVTDISCAAGTNNNTNSPCITSKFATSSVSVGSLQKKQTYVTLINHHHHHHPRKFEQRLSLFQVRNMSTASKEPPSPEDLQVEHDKNNQRFIIRIGESLAVLDYEEIHPGVLNLYHTEVPPDLRGMSIGQLLAKHAFDYVVQHNLKMKLSCTYLQDYLIKHPNDKHKKHIVVR